MKQNIPPTIIKILPNIFSAVVFGDIFPNPIVVKLVRQ
jgi:hypothetical protein